MGVDTSPPPWRAPLAYSAGVAAACLAVLPHLSRQLGPRQGFMPAVLAVVLVLDLLSAYLLVRQFRDTGEVRILAMSWAYTWSLVTMLGYAGAFPGVLATHPALQTAPSVTPWLYIAWHTGFPVLLGLAWAPAPRRWTRDCPPALRRRVAYLSLLAWTVAPLALVTYDVQRGPSLPVLIHGLDTSLMTSITAPVALPLVALSLAFCLPALRHRHGPERWAGAAVWTCAADLVLTYLSRHRFSLGWYAGRTLTVLAAGVVLLAVVRETTRVKGALHQALGRAHEVEEQQRSVLDGLDEGVVLMDLDGVVLLANPAAERLFPGVAGGGMRMPSVPAVRPDGTPISADERPTIVAMQTGLPQRGVVMGVNGTGAERTWLSVNTHPVLGVTGELCGVVGSFSDVTVREAAREALEAARDAAIAADKAKTSFLAMTSHEIRTPLNGLLGMTGLLLSTPLDTAQRELVTTAQACGHQLLSLLNDVLDVSKAEAGRLELDLEEVDLLDLVDDAIAMVADVARGKGLRLEAVVHHDVPRRVVADGLRLKQAVVNLVGNAVKFTAAGRVELRLSFDGMLRVEVTDTGIGVPQQDVAALFEAFQQADASTTRRYGGTGLGLAIVREIAQLHGGAAGARSQPGYGSTFWITAAVTATSYVAVDVLHGLGVRVDDDDPLRRERLEQLVQRAGGTCGDDLVLTTRAWTGEGATLRVAPTARCSTVLHALAGSPEREATVGRLDHRLTGRVLLAEDNPVNQRVATLMLEQLGLTVTVVANGREAVNAALAGGHDVVLMDCQMPELDGLGATRELRAQAYATPVLALTASASPQDERDCLAAGMDGYLTKPIDAAALATALAAVLPRPSIRV